MKINLPKGMFKNMPSRAWTVIALGVTALLILLGMTLYKYGGVFIKIDKGATHKILNEIKE